jgi:hypothetical protein
LGVLPFWVFSTELPIRARFPFIGFLQKPLQKRISRKALTPVNPVENTLSIYEQEVGL